MSNEGESVAKALFSCTRVELLFNESPAGEKPQQPQQELKESCSSERLSTPMRSRSGSEIMFDTMGMEEHRGPIFNGEKVALLLSLTPDKKKLESVFEMTFGISAKGSSNRQIDLWNKLTELLFIQLHLLSEPPASTLPDDPARSDDLVTLPGAHQTPDRSKIAFPVQSTTSIQKSKLMSRRGREYYRPSVFKLEFIVKDINAPSTDKTRCYIWLAIELPNPSHLQTILSEVTELGVSSPAENIFNRSLESSGKLGMSRSSGRSEKESKSLLMQIYNSIPIPPRTSNTTESCGNTPYMIVMKPAWLFDPLRVELHVVEPFPGYNCVQVSISNPLNHNVLINELSIHLPTTVNAKAEINSTGNTTSGSTYCMLATSPTTMGAHIIGMSGFEAVFKIECFMMAVENEVLPVTLSGGETYGFMFALKPYDLKPSSSGGISPVAKNNNKIPMRGGGDRIVGNYFGSTPRHSVDSNESFSSQRIPSNPSTPTEPIALKSTLTISFKVEGLSSAFDKAASVRWMLHPSLASCSGNSERPPEAQRHLMISKYIPPRARRRESLRSGVIVTTPTSITSASRSF